MTNQFNDPTIENLQAIAELLNIAYQELLIGKSIMAPLAIKDCIDRLDAMGINNNFEYITR